MNQWLFQESLNNINMYYVTSRNKNANIYCPPESNSSLSNKNYSTIYYKKKFNGQTKNSSTIENLSNSQKNILMNSVALKITQSPVNGAMTNSNYNISINSENTNSTLTKATILSSTNRKDILQSSQNNSQIIQNSNVSFFHKTGNISSINNLNSKDSNLINSNVLALHGKRILGSMKKNEHNENNVNIIQIDATNLFKCQKCKIYLHQIYNLILLTMTIMCLVHFVFNNGLLKLFEGFMTINIYSLLIKSDIYFSSICLLDCCRISNFGGNESLEENKYRLLYRGKELIDHYTIFSKTINNFVDKHQLNDIYTFLSTKTEYEYLLKNYNANKVQSNLLDELLLFHYSIIKASGESTFQTCRMRDFFANKKSK